MDFYGKKNLWKFILLIFASLIGALTLLYTESFLKELRQEELRKMNVWAMSMSILLEADNTSELTLPAEIMQSNHTIPVIVTDGEDNIIEVRNLNNPRAEDPEWLSEQMLMMKEEGNVIDGTYAGKVVTRVYFNNSNLLTKLRLYPLILLLVISMFVAIAYIAFSNSRKAEQNQVWTGLAKETAHQIGTPLSSLMGWLEMLKMNNADATMVAEMEKDINRLNTITDRFSKIGSQPLRSPQDIGAVTQNAVEYLKNRSPKRISINCQLPQAPVLVKLNLPLYEWVIENLLRNAIDAINIEGKIDIAVSLSGKTVLVDVSDTGKGIPAGKLKTVFRPGYSTKKRGWGLGLSLAKRIVEEYHEGKIFVAKSEPQTGTTFRIVLKQNEA
jgi:hypothetical protein